MLTHAKHSIYLQYTRIRHEFIVKFNLHSKLSVVNPTDL